VRWLYKELAEQHDPDKVMVTIADADSDFSPVYLEHVEAAFYEQPDGGIVMYDGALNTWGNFLDTWNPVIRHHEMKRCQLHYQALWLGRHHAMSNYSLTLGLAHIIDYWTPDTMQEDHHTYTKMRVLLREGAPSVPIFSLIVNDLVKATSDRYVQAKRHSWGITELAWVVTLYPYLEFKNFLSLFFETWYSQIVMMVMPWWAVFLYPMAWRLICALNPATLTFLASLMSLRIATRWVCDTAELAYIWYGVLAPRSSVPRPHWFGFLLLRLLDIPLGLVGDLIFVLLPRWHCVVRSFFTPHLQYINAPKGSKAMGKSEEVGSSEEVRPSPFCHLGAPKKASSGHAVSSSASGSANGGSLPPKAAASALPARRVDGGAASS
jgi:hypothetical protein